MAHKVIMKAPGLELSKTDVMFEIKKGDNMFGTITISKGAIEWRPANHQKKRRMTWSQFDKAFREKQ